MFVNISLTITIGHNNVTHGPQWLFLQIWHTQRIWKKIWRLIFSPNLAILRNMSRNLQLVIFRLRMLCDSTVSINNQWLRKMCLRHREVVLEDWSTFIKISKKSFLSRKMFCKLCWMRIWPSIYIFLVASFSGKNTRGKLRHHMLERKWLQQRCLQRVVKMTPTCTCSEIHSQ